MPDVCGVQSEHVSEITPKDWTHLINILLYGFNSLNLIFFPHRGFFSSSSWMRYDYNFDLLLQFRFRGGRRFYKIYSITIQYMPSFIFQRVRSPRITTLLYWIPFILCMCDYFLFLFRNRHTKKREYTELRWMQPKRLQLCFNFNGSHLL